MNGNPYWRAALLGTLTSLPAAAMAYLANQLAGTPFPPFNIFDLLARMLPGPVVTFAIGLIVKLANTLEVGPTAETAKLAEQILAMILFAFAGAVFGPAIQAFARNNSARLVWSGLLNGLFFASIILLVNLSLSPPNLDVLAASIWFACLFCGWGAVLGRLVREFTTPGAVLPLPSMPRRQFLYLVVIGSITLVVTALRVSRTGRQATTPENAPVDDVSSLSLEETTGPARSPAQNELDARVENVPGVRPELTPNQDFYRIDINLLPPRLDAETWRLKVGGLVEEPLELSLADIRALPAHSQVITLECISNTVGGDLIGTSLWKGARLKDVLAEARLLPQAQEVFIKSADGFYESVNNNDLFDERTLLVYEMNGEPLPVEHGFPLRIYIPNRFGMKQPKWISSLEAIDYDGSGFWVDRGWSVRAIPHTTSVIDVIGGQGTALDPIPIGGIAFAGARGISRVELQVDGGQWEMAELRSPALSLLTWIQWRYFWPLTSGKHTFTVRAYDGNGSLQVARLSPPQPNGATGLHSVTSTF